MCQSRISDKCTDEETHGLPDGRKVCIECLPFCPGGEQVKTGEGPKVVPLSAHEALGGAPRGMRYD